MGGLKNNMFQVRRWPEFEFKEKLPYIIQAISVPREEKGRAFHEEEKRLPMDGVRLAILQL